MSIPSEPSASFAPISHSYPTDEVAASASATSQPSGSSDINKLVSEVTSLISQIDPDKPILIGKAVVIDRALANNIALLDKINKLKQVLLSFEDPLKAQSSLINLGISTAAAAEETKRKGEGENFTPIRGKTYNNIIKLPFGDKLGAIINKSGKLYTSIGKENVIGSYSASETKMQRERTTILASAPRSAFDEAKERVEQDIKQVVADWTIAQHEQNSRSFAHVTQLFGGPKGFDSLPTLIPPSTEFAREPLQIPADKLTAPIMQGMDDQGRRFFTLRYKKLGSEALQSRTFYEMDKEKSNCWTSRSPYHASMGIGGPVDYAAVFYNKRGELDFDLVNQAGSPTETYKNVKQLIDNGTFGDIRLA